MPTPEFDRSHIRFKPLAERPNKVRIERDRVLPDDEGKPFPPEGQMVIDEIAQRLAAARERDRARMLTFGAHTIKNGLAPVLIWLIENGWITHLATNGAGIIHDWEFAYQGESSEDVRTNVAKGEFGIWEETCAYLNLAIAVGAWRGMGYGESIGRMVLEDGLEIPSEQYLLDSISNNAASAPETAASAADLLAVIRTLKLAPGRLAIRHTHMEYGLQAAAYRLGVPFTGHPMIGHDIIYTHPANSCAAIGRAAQRDFLRFALGVSQLGEGGVYLSIGSAVMSPMVFEKSLSMAQNVALQQGRQIEGHFIGVVDLAESHWDWGRGEPPENNPDYYLRYNKSFARMGGTLRYLSADNRDFLLALVRALRSL